MCCGFDEQLHTDYRNPVERKGQHGYSLREREGRNPCLDRLLLLFWAHYIKDGPHLIRFRWLPFTENKGEDVVNYIKEEGYLQMQREKWLNWLHLSLGSLA